MPQRLAVVLFSAVLVAIGCHQATSPSEAPGSAPSPSASSPSSGLSADFVRDMRLLCDSPDSPMMMSIRDAGNHLDPSQVVRIAAESAEKQFRTADAHTMLRAIMQVQVTPAMKSKLLHEAADRPPTCPLADIFDSPP
jgi:hypothetical protein